MGEHAGGERLTPREPDVLRHTVDGNRNRDIAHKMFIAEETVKTHMRQIMAKLGANGRTQAHEAANSKTVLAHTSAG